MTRRTLAALLAAGAICAAAFPGTAAAFKPVEGIYNATTPGTTTPTNVMRLEVLKRNRTYRTRVLQLADDCVGSSLVTPVGLGRLFAKDFKYQSTVTTGTLKSDVDIDGLFSGAKLATARVHTTQTELNPPAGSPPTASKVCDDITSFTLRLVKPAKPDK